MRRFMLGLGMALVVGAVLSSSAQAQYVVGRPVYVAPYPSYSYYPPVTYSYYPSVATYSAPPAVAYAAPSVVTYSAPVMTYAPSMVVAPAGVYTTRSYYGYGIFRPRGYYTQSYYTPLR